jgi:hypothetical protein
LVILLHIIVYHLARYLYLTWWWPKLNQHAFQDNTKCSVVAEVSNETAHGRGTYSSLSKLVENASGCDKGKRDNSSVSGQTWSKKRDPSTNSILDKEKVSSCGSAGTKFSSPCSWGLSKETDSTDCVSLLDNQFCPVGRCSTGGTRANNGDHNYFGQPVVCTYLLICDWLMRPCLGVAGAFPKAAGLKSWLAGPRSYLKQGLKFWLGLPWFGTWIFIHIIYFRRTIPLFISENGKANINTVFFSAEHFFLALHLPIFCTKLTDILMHTCGVVSQCDV